MPVTIGGTNIVGDSARLFQWQMVHYLVHGGPNDPVIQSASPPTNTAGQGGYLAWNTSVVLPPVPGTQTPPAVPLPRVQSIISAGTAGATMANNTGGVYIGTLPQGSWLESIEAYLYTAFTGATNFGVYYAPAGSFSAANSPGFQPQTVFQLVSFTGAGTANTIYSTDAIDAANKTAWTAAPGVGPGNATAASAGQLASLGDIDLYFLVTTTASAGTAAVRVKFTGLEG